MLRWGGLIDDEMEGESVIRVCSASSASPENVLAFWASLGRWQVNDSDRVSGGIAGM